VYLSYCGVHLPMHSVFAVAPTAKVEMPSPQAVQPTDFELATVPPRYVPTGHGRAVLPSHDNPLSTTAGSTCSQTYQESQRRGL
jgi:hypothetical protein